MHAARRLTPGVVGVGDQLIQFCSAGRAIGGCPAGSPTGSAHRPVSRSARPALHPPITAVITGPGTPRTRSVVIAVLALMSVSVPIPRQSAWLRQNVGFIIYIPDCEARYQTGPKVRQTRRHPGSAEDRSGRQTLPGRAVPMRLRKTRHPANQLAQVGRCSVVRMLARPTQIRAEALPGLRGPRHDPPRPPKLLPRVRIRAGPGRPAGRQPVLCRLAQAHHESPRPGQRLRLR